MSTNIGQTSCKYCGGEVRLEEDPRPITIEETGEHKWDEYRTMKVATALCPDCEAKYLAWCQPPTRGIHQNLKTPHAEGPFYDLSFRSAFNDEPDADDLPKWHIVEYLELKRVPFDQEKPPNVLRRRYVTS